MAEEREGFAENMAKVRKLCDAGSSINEARRIVASGGYDQWMERHGPLAIEFITVDGILTDSREEDGRRDKMAFRQRLDDRSRFVGQRIIVRPLLTGINVRIYSDRLSEDDPERFIDLIIPRDSTDPVTIETTEDALLKANR